MSLPLKLVKKTALIIRLFPGCTPDKT